MSKFLKVLIVMLTIAAFAAPVMAADNFSVSGNMLVYGTYTDGDAADGATSTWGYQKLRVQGVFKASDVASITFRTDFQEGTWGSDAGHGRQMLGAGTTMADLDRAYIDVKLDKVDLRAGTQYVAFGKSGSFIYNDTGITATIKGEMPITMTYAVLDDNKEYDIVNDAEINKNLTISYPSGTTPDSDATDRQIFGANIKLNAFNVFGGIDFDNTASVYMFGATYQAKYDAISVVAEADFFTGEKTETMDAVGMTAFVDASMAVSDTLSAGGAVYYAAGTKKTDEAAYTRIGNGFGVWDAFTRGPFADENYRFNKRPYDAFAANAGVIAIQGYADMKVNDSLNGGGSLVYAQPEEDASTGTDSMILASVFATYKLAENVDFHNGIQYVAYDKEAANQPESDLSVMTGLNVSF